MTSHLYKVYTVQHTTYYYNNDDKGNQIPIDGATLALIMAELPANFKLVTSTDERQLEKFYIATISFNSETNTLNISAEGCMNASNVEEYDETGEWHQ